MKIFFKLTIFEIKKMICRKYILAAVLCMTAALGCYMYTSFYFDHKEWEGEIKLYKNIEGKLNEEKYNFLVDELQAVNQYSVNLDTGEIETGDGAEEKGKYMPTRVGDKIIIEIAIENCNSVFSNEENRKLIIQRAQENIEEYSNSEDSDYSYQIAFNKKIIDTYKNQPQIYIMNPLSKIMWQSCLSFNIHSPMIILLLIMVITPLFVREKETGMQKLIDTYEKGRFKLFLSKIAAAFAVTVLIAVYFEAVQLIYFKIFVPELTGIGYPIQSVIPRCPFNITIGGFIIMKMVYVSIASLLVSMVIILFSVIFSKRVICLGSSAIFTAAAYGIVFYQKIWKTEVMRDMILAHTEEELSALKTYLFTYLFYPMEYYEKFECVNILNHPFFPQTVVLGITMAAIIVIIPAAYFLYVRPKNKLV